MLAYILINPSRTLHIRFLHFGPPLLNSSHVEKKQNKRKNLYFALLVITSGFPYCEYIKLCNEIEFFPSIAKSDGH